jgi:hypothetical protein
MKKQKQQTEIVVPGVKKYGARKRNWDVEHHGKNIHVVSVKRPKMKDFEQWILLLADNHHDNPSADHAMEKRLLDKALERDAIIISVGDTLDLMQGKGDKRSAKSALRSSLLSDSYFDKVIEQAADFYAPYASHWAVLATGNHESAWERHHESSPTQHLVRAMKDRAESNVGAGGYGGFIKFQMQLGNNRLAYTMKYQHGTGGSGAMMSFGVLDTRRMFSWLEGVDSIVISHLHTSNVVGVTRQFLNCHNGVYRVENRHCDLIRVGTTKDAWKDGSAGWEVEKGFGPSPMRQKWVRLFVQYEQYKNDSGIHGAPRIAWDVIDAQ